MQVSAVMLQLGGQ